MQRAQEAVPSGKPEPVPVSITIDSITLAGNLHVPLKATSIVIFAHGSGSSRFSPRNRFVAEVLNEYGIGTLLIDLLTPEEERIDEQTRELRFNIPLLAARLEKIGQWVLESSQPRGLKLGYFGASTGGAAALAAAASQPKDVIAVVSRGGRPDLVMDILPQVKAPTLLIVGGLDEPVIAWNKQALEKLNEQSRIEIVPGATHLFEEPGTLEAVAQLAADWFKKHSV